MRRKRIEGAQEPERIAMPPAQFSGTKPLPDDTKRPIPVTIRTKPETITPKEETSMADDKAKERVLSRILQEKACSRGRLMNYCGVSKDELESVTAALVVDGKIKSWPKGRACIYTPPDAPDPHGVAAGNTPAPPKKKKAAAPQARTKAETPVPSPRKPGGNGVYAAAIADLERRRTAAMDTIERIDTAIEMLQALA